LALSSKNTCRAINIGAVIVAGAIFCAVWFLIDTHPNRTGSLLKYLGLAMLAGVLLLAGEFIVLRVSAQDSVSDPLHKRTGRLAILLLAVAVLTGFIAAILKLM
jgi:hypothetical protein